ncbi:MAG: hypothetical protein WC107_07620 [Patescibacteria group bacterium]|jgi:hypothetical protein
MKNIHAFTETNTTPPGYISVNDEAGHLTVTVRTRGAQVPSTIEMNRDQLAAMHADVGAYLAATAPAAPVVEPQPVKVTINGSKRTIAADGPDGISYAALCDAANKKPEQTPTVTFSFADGRSGSIVRGEFAPVEAGAVYNVMVTGNA